MSVRIAPATEDDARAIAAILEDGVCPYPGYQVQALTSQPWIYVLDRDVADKVLARLYPEAKARARIEDPDRWMTALPEPEPAPAPEPVREPEPANGPAPTAPPIAPPPAASEPAAAGPAPQAQPVVETVIEPPPVVAEPAPAPPVKRVGARARK